MTWTQVGITRACIKDERHRNAITRWLIMKFFVSRVQESDGSFFESFTALSWKQENRRLQVLREDETHGSPPPSVHANHQDIEAMSNKEVLAIWTVFIDAQNVFCWPRIGLSRRIPIPSCCPNQVLRRWLNIDRLWYLSSSWSNSTLRCCTQFVTRSVPIRLSTLITSKKISFDMHKLRSTSVPTTTIVVRQWPVKKK